ncbi:MAG: hypothetical protein AABX25_02885 [Nanoarchaeota archaeon]
MFRKFLIWIVKNLLILLLVAAIFSEAALDLPGMVKGLFKDVFQYASPEAQKEVVSKLTSACSPLDGKDVSGLQQQKTSGPMPIDFSKIDSLCKDYNSGKINDTEFFSNVVRTAIPDRLELPKIQAFDKYNSATDFLNKNKIYYFIVLFALLAVLFLLAGNLDAFLTILTGISFGMGILILLPYAAIMAYDKFVGIDTTPILSSILQGSLSLEPKAIISIVLLLILRTYTSFILTLGVIFLGAGIAGKVYRFRLKRKNKSPDMNKKEETKGKAKEEKKGTKLEKIKKPSKEKQSKEEIEEAYEHRDRTAKEILKELDEIHEKKMKEKKN